VRLISSVEDFDEHAVHVVSLDSVPEERDEHDIVAQDVGDTASEARVGEMLGYVQNDQQDDERRAEVQQDPSYSAIARFTTQSINPLRL